MDYVTQYTHAWMLQMGLNSESVCVAWKLWLVALRRGEGGRRVAELSEGDVVCGYAATTHT